MLEEEQSCFLCVSYWAIQVTVRQRLPTAMMLDKEMESEVKPVFPFHLLCICSFPHHQSETLCQVTHRNIETLSFPCNYIRQAIFCTVMWFFLFVS